MAKLDLTTSMVTAALSAVLSILSAHLVACPCVDHPDLILPFALARDSISVQLSYGSNTVLKFTTTWFV